MKIEFDVPKFEKEMSVTIIIRKDGEVVCNTTTPPNTDGAEEKSVKIKKTSGNMRDSDF